MSASEAFSRLLRFKFLDGMAFCVLVKPSVCSSGRHEFKDLFPRGFSHCASSQSSWWDYFQYGFRMFVFLLWGHFQKTLPLSFWSCRRKATFICLWLDSETYYISPLEYFATFVWSKEMSKMKGEVANFIEQTLNKFIW